MRSRHNPHARSYSDVFTFTRTRLTAPDHHRCAVCTVGCGNGRNLSRRDLFMHGCDNSLELMRCARARRSADVALADNLALPYRSALPSRPHVSARHHTGGISVVRGNARVCCFTGWLFFSSKLSAEDLDQRKEIGLPKVSRFFSIPFQSNSPDGHRVPHLHQFPLPDPWAAHQPPLQVWSVGRGAEHSRPPPLFYANRRLSSVLPTQAAGQPPYFRCVKCMRGFLRRYVTTHPSDGVVQKWSFLQVAK